MRLKFVHCDEMKCSPFFYNAQCTARPRWDAYSGRYFAGGVSTSSKSKMFCSCLLFAPRCAELLLVAYEPRWPACLVPFRLSSRNDFTGLTLQKLFSLLLTQNLKCIQLVHFLRLGCSYDLPEIFTVTRLLQMVPNWMLKFVMKLLKHFCFKFVQFFF